MIAVQPNERNYRVPQAADPPLICPVTDDLKNALKGAEAFLGESVLTRTSDHTHYLRAAQTLQSLVQSLTRASASVPLLGPKPRGACIDLAHGSHLDLEVAAVESYITGTAAALVAKGGLNRHGRENLSVAVTHLTSLYHQVLAAVIYQAEEDLKHIATEHGAASVIEVAHKLAELRTGLDTAEAARAARANDPVPDPCEVPVLARAVRND